MDEGRRRRLEELLAECIDRLNSGESIDKERLAIEFPDLAGDLLGRLQTFESLVPAAQSDEPLGSIGEYRLLRKLGRGGMGVVYEAWEGAMERPVALKVLPGGLLTDLRTIARFQNEARAAGKLQHPNVVRVFGMGVEGNTPFFAMEYVEGETLERALRRRRIDAGREREAVAESRSVFEETELGLSRAAKLAEAFAEVADGLQHAHQRGVVHRDIKPSNLIIDLDANLRILDFGLARLEGQESLTLSGDVLGTPSYMSPEQARVRKSPVDYRTDLYSLGATIYEVLTGRPPFVGRDHQDTLSQIIQRDPAPLRRLNHRVPRDFETIVLKCLRKDPDARYGTAEALAQDLRRFARGDPIEARPQGTWEKLLRRAWRTKLKTALVACLLAALLATAGLAVSHGREARRRALEAYPPTVRAAVELLQLGSLSRRADVWGSLAIDERRKVLGRGHPREAFKGEGPDPVEEAVQLLREAAASVPGRADAFYHLGRGLLLLDREKEAVAVLERLLEQNPGFVPAGVLLAAVRERRGEKEAARALRDRAERSARGTWAADWLAAEESARKGRSVQAEAAYSKLIDLESEGREPYVGAMVEVRIRRGVARLELKDFHGAFQDFTVARFLWPQAAEPALLEAKTYRLLGDSRKAAELCDRLFLHARFKDEVAAGAIALHVSLGDEESALEWAEKLRPGYLKELHSSFSLGALGRCEESVAAARNAIALCPGDTDAYFSLAGTLSRCLERHEEALDAVEAALRRKPGDARTYFQRGALFWRSGKAREAIESYRLALEFHLENANDATEGAAIRAELGLALVDHGQAREGIGELELAVALDPTNSDAHNNLGLALLKMGKLDASLAALDRAAALDPEHSFPRHNRGIVLERQGKLDDAIEEYRAAGPRIPKNQWACCDLGRLLVGKGRLDEAIAAYGKALEIEPGNEAALWGLTALLRRELGGASRGAIDRLVEAIDGSVESGEKIAPLVSNVLALALLEADGKRDLDRALDAALRGIDAASATGGLAGELVRTLKRVLDTAERESPGGKASKALLFRLPSCVAIDVALDALPSGELDPDLRAEVLEKLSEMASSSSAARRLAYLEARLLERGGDGLAAAAKYAQAADAEPGTPEPHLRLARCLLARGDAAAAAARLRSAIESGLDDGEVWNLWAAISLRDLERPPDGLLADLPGSLKDHGEDIRWLLERLDRGEALRIDCGGQGFEVPGRPPWGRDRFFSGGYSSSLPSLEIAGASDADGQALYRTSRAFGEDAVHAAYQVPLPEGKYHVTLHLAETWFQAAGMRQFDVAIESLKVLERHEPLETGFATADRRSFEAVVTDGLLEIGFIPLSSSPQVCGIEIVKAE